MCHVGMSTARLITWLSTNVKVLDRWAPPSREASGNDINKVVRADYGQQLYADLGQEAMKVWKDPTHILNPFFHGTGWIISASNESIPFMHASLKTLKRLGYSGAGFVTRQEVQERWPTFSGPMKDWEIMWNEAAGWANADKAVAALAASAMSRGVQYISGDAGHVKKLLFDSDSKCIGVACEDGSSHFADVVILAAGAATSSILDMEGQLVAKGHSVVHVQLTREEVQHYKNIPILDNLEDGIIFPPTEDGIMKITGQECFKNEKSASPHPGISLPRYRSVHPKDGIPERFDRKIRMFLRDTLPELSDRRWDSTRICWDADTADLHFIVGQHPKHANLKLACGGSAHGFKFLPVIGAKIADMIEEKLASDLASAWKWRPGCKAEDSGPRAHPLGPLLDMSDLPGWEHKEIHAKL
ncbi:putative sarcosine oxidase [Cadophora sp. DSE1049]|nr:putative sarcosine oxidase [Cadophora sp. DSE1049]